MSDTGERKGPARVFALLASLIACAVASSSEEEAPPRYPANPAATTAAIYLSATGVSAYRRPGLDVAWTALRGVSTLEAVPAGDRLLVGSADGLFVLERESGRILQRYFPGRRVFSPTVVDGVAYTADAGGALRALELASGDTLWEVQLPGWVYPPAVVGGRLYTGGSEGTVWALDTATGAVRWARSVGQELVYRPVAVAAETVAVTTFAAEIVALAAGDGTVRWRRRLESPALSPVALAEMLFVPTMSGNVYRLDATRGTLVWQRRLPGPLRSNFGHVAGRLAVRDESGRLTLLSAADGSELWAREVSSSGVGTPFFIEAGLVVFMADRGKNSPPRPVVYSGPLKRIFKE